MRSRGQRAGAVLASGALFAGAALVAVGLFVEIPAVLMVIGLGLLMGAIGLALLRKKVWPLLGALALGLVIGISPTVAAWLTDSKKVSDFADDYQAVFVVAGLLVAAYLLGIMTVEWPKRPDEHRERDQALP